MSWVIALTYLIEVKLFGPSQHIEQRMKLMQMIHKHLETNSVSVDIPMVEHVGQLLTDKALTLSVSEKSSAGYLTYWLNSDEKVAEQIRSRLGSIRKQPNHRR